LLYRLSQHEDELQLFQLIQGQHQGDPLALLSDSLCSLFY
jgi:hypothetical protein